VFVCVAYKVLEYLLPGYGQERGGIVTKLHNGHWKALDIVYLENIPWFMPLYLHTLKIVANGREIKPRKFRKHSECNFHERMTC
jgi:hypothetical protein